MKLKHVAILCCVVALFSFGGGMFGGWIFAREKYAAPVPVTVLPRETPVVIPEVTPEPVVIPPEPEINPYADIPEPQYYECRSGERTDCITPATPYSEGIAKIVFMEGGGLNMKIGVDLLQLLDNRMRNAWECEGNGGWCPETWKGLNPYDTDYYSMPREYREKLAVFVASQPYVAPGGQRQHPAWNAWELPFPTASVNEIPYIGREYVAIVEAVNLWLENPSSPILITMDGATYLPGSKLISMRLVYVYVGYGTGSEARIEHLEQTAAYIYRTEVGGVSYNLYYLTEGYI